MGSFEYLCLFVMVWCSLANVFTLLFRDSKATLTRHIVWAFVGAAIFVIMARLMFSALIPGIHTI